MKNLKYSAASLAVSLLMISHPSIAATPDVGDVAPQIKATTLKGKKFDLNKLKGKKPVYLKFWATWCSYCKAEMPHLNSISKEYGDKIEVIAVNVGMNDSPSKINNLYSSLGFELPTIFDENGHFTMKYGVIGTPQHILIDKSGRIAYKTFLVNDELDRKIEEWAFESTALSTPSLKIKGDK